jgi:hypothetical protein
MKRLLLAVLLPLHPALHAAQVEITLDAPSYPDRHVLLYHYLDAFTLRTERIAEGRTDSNGQVVLTADVQGTERALLRVDGVGADLFLRPGTYHVKMPAPDPDEVRTISGTTRVDLVFIDLDPLDVNALVSDLNGRLDAFLAEDLATDQDAGMEAVAKARNGSGALVPDTAKKRPELFLSPRWDEARVDTFARKLRKFYASVKDPWFQSDVEYGIAGLRLGPRTNDRDLFGRYLRDKPVLYEVPEYVRFLTAFFKDHLMRFPFRTDTDALLDDIRNARTDSLKRLFGRNDLLQDDRLNELVLITQLYAEQGNKLFDHAGILSVLSHVRDHSAYSEHRAIAANMLWDLTAMTPGTEFPHLVVRDIAGASCTLDSLLHGPVCLLVSATDGSYGEQELAALEKLQAEYSAYVTFIGIALDRTPTGLAAWLHAHPGLGRNWFIPADRQYLLDGLRIRSIPSLFMLQDHELTASPGPLPSQGLVAVLFRIKAKADEDLRLKSGRGAPPPMH